MKQINIPKTRTFNVDAVVYHATNSELGIITKSGRIVAIGYGRIEAVAKKRRRGKDGKVLLLGR